LGEQNLKEHIKTIGLFNNKAKNIILLSEQLVEKFNGEVPADRDILTQLPGVGRKTANVFLNVWYNQPTLAVDTHVMRIAHRLDFSQGKTPLEIEIDLLKVLPPEIVKNTNHWLVLFGRYICKAQHPLCDKCPIAAYCHCSDKISR
jgi:endonuclease-3